MTNVLSSQTTTQVLVMAKTVLRVDDLEFTVGKRTAQIQKVEVRWFFRGGTWSIDSVHLWGPIIRKADGTLSQMHVSQLTHPPELAARSRQPVTPPDVLAAALTLTPVWQPELPPSPYPPHPTLRRSL